KSTIPFMGSEEAVSMPLKSILPVAYPNFQAPSVDAKTLSSGHDFFAGIDFSSLKDPAAQKHLSSLLRERTAGKGVVLALYGAFGPSWKRVKYATYEKIDGGWDVFPQLGTVWQRVLQRASTNSPVLSRS